MLEPLKQYIDELDKEIYTYHQYNQKTTEVILRDLKYIYAELLEEIHSYE